jgi:hypothetical protein
MAERERPGLVARWQGALVRGRRRRFRPRAECGELARKGPHRDDQRRLALAPGHRPRRERTGDPAEHPRRLCRHPAR